ncbi:MAG: 4-hydroxy-3-methylbut-2-enyl diphosphate reductase [Opitutaceae bacterium]|nr:4-hydroxy-3-methylbut-2-enyl diphosphate reductase [Opitutaceae bacterium]
MRDSVTLVFDSSNRLGVRVAADGLEPAPFEGFAAITQPREFFTLAHAGDNLRIFFAQAPGIAEGIEFCSLEQLESAPAALSPLLADLLPALDPHLIHIPYLQLGENDFIYKFRPEKERNLTLYTQDAHTSALYQSALCSAIKAIARRREGVATAPIPLDFGAVRYLIPSHFGFCLGVKNAIDRAYETLAANPGRRVFMLSELIHNPFVNEDLLRRGLRYLQSEKGVPFAINGQKSTSAPGLPLLWDALTPDDIVIIPAFGATDEDKKRLVRKGIAVCQYDATCMLVEKVWKAARAYGRAGYTVVIHGKHEHEETKATFSNTRRYAPAVIVRNLDETRRLGEIVTESLRDSSSAQARFEHDFAERHTPGFSVVRDLARVAVVNQTTLLMKETQEIIAYLRNFYAVTFGAELPDVPARVGGSGRTDTLCYATQVNQDALARALEEPLDAAFIIGGKNSSNTYQLYRLCEQKLGDKAFFIQSETNILSLAQVEHYVFSAQGPTQGGYIEVHPLWPEGPGGQPRRILITGGASCPDGVIQQVITRINSLFPAGQLLSMEAVQARVLSNALV